MRSSLKTALLALALVASAGSTLLAQSAVQVPDRELEALRYYYRQSDTDAVQAEIRRLQEKYPGWAPPTDMDSLFTGGPNAGAVWDLLGSGQVQRARAQLDSLHENYPDWTPPDDLVQAVAVAEAQQEITRAYNAANYSGVVSVATATPAIVSCERVNNAWLLGDAYGELKRVGEAVAVWRGVIDTCSDSDLAIPTLEKANAYTTEAQLRGLFADATRKYPDDKEELDALLERLMAGRKFPAGSDTASTARSAAASPRQSAAQTRASRAAAASAAAASAITSAAQAGDWSTCVAESMTPATAEIRAQRAWCLYNMDRPTEALVGFEDALTQGIPADQARDVRFGIALAYLKMNMAEEASQVASTADFSDEQRRQIEASIIEQRAFRAYEGEEYAVAVSYLDAYERLMGGTRRDLETLKAYALLNSGRRIPAQDIFRRLDSTLSTPESRNGLEASGAVFIPY
ncbi:hypothetical protein FDP22_11540 [Paroceanicella profunda]|uniref:Tetratricopeptide repeat protein n=1 Tax=Paroceanicella profunda TaxID=2579971 RepID=A0A5B8FHF4_9RHOB|nr:hypothetical protein [Paroceanicella profunda]QDL92351.1 hypothetical protein FDP22_11540 [Paroceanicella profunda]